MVTQTASDGQLDDSLDKKNIADVDNDLRSNMQLHRLTLQEMQKKLESENLPNISDKDVQGYKEKLVVILQYVTNPENTPAIYDYINAVQRFNEIGTLIIRMFNNALFIWKNFKASGVNIKDKSDGERAYEDRLDECHTELGNLLAEFKADLPDLDIETHSG